MNIIFDNHDYAVEFIEKINNLYKETGVVRYSDVVRMIGCNPSEQDQFRGWLDISSFRINTSYFVNGCEVIAAEPIDLLENGGFVGTTKLDNVNHPVHYKTKNGLEAIDVIEAFTDGLEGIEATDTGNVIKYICRWKKKNGLEDLKKAQWYLTHLINHVEKENES